MSKLDSAVFCTIGILSLLIILILIWFSNPDIANKLVSNNLKYGDLYQMAKIRDFKYKLPDTIPIKTTHYLKEADMIIMGDSFFNISAGFPIFAEQMEKLLGKKIHNYDIQGSGEVWRKTNPIDYLEENNYLKDGKKRILILESVDRGIMMRYGNIEKIKPVFQNASVQDINDKTPPIGAIELISINDGNLRVEGWGADNNTGSPLAKIIININGKPAGTARTGFFRPDIAKFFKNDTWGNSGWSFDKKIKHSSNNYKVTATFIDTNANEFISGEKSIAISNDYFTNFRVWIAKTDVLIKDKLKSLNYLIMENPLTNAVSETVNTIKFRLLSQTPALTPKYSLNPHILYYKEEVNFYDYPLTLSEIIKTADNLQFISNYLGKTYDVQFFFMPMPTKYTIYHQRTGTNFNNPFFKELFDELKKRNVKYIDLYGDFMNSTELLYFQSDTHWNDKGIKQGIDKTVSIIRDFYQAIP